MNKVIVFGLNDFAELAFFYLTNDSEYEVVAFCVNKKYIVNKKRFKGLPVIAFEDVIDLYPPNKFNFFAPMAPSKMNMVREDVYNNIKKKGYKLISYVSSKATIFNTKVGENCLILENNTIQPYVEIGDNVILWSGNHIGHHSKIHNHNMITSHVVVSGHCEIFSYCNLGVNATIRDNLLISEGSFIGMGSVLTKSTEPWSIYIGSPAKKIEKSSKEI